MHASRCLPRIREMLSAKEMDLLFLFYFVKSVFIEPLSLVDFPTIDAFHTMGIYTIILILR